MNNLKKSFFKNYFIVKLVYLKIFVFSIIVLKNVLFLPLGNLTIFQEYFNKYLSNLANVWLEVRSNFKWLESDNNDIYAAIKLLELDI